MRVDALPDILTDAGVPVRTVQGWRGRGTPLKAVHGIVWHHTATPATASDLTVVRVLRDGRPDLPGPLAQCGLSRDGTWWIVADGRCNHAGRGSWPGLDGNDDTIGVEAFNVGTGAERWPGVQLASWRVGTAAIADAYRVDVTATLIAHREWAPRRKVDPWGLNMPAERATVAALIVGRPDLPPTRGDDMPYLCYLEGNRTLFHAVGANLVPIEDPVVARLLADRDDFWEDVPTLTPTQAKVFRVVPADLSGGGVDVSALAGQVARLLKVTT